MVLPTNEIHMCVSCVTNDSLIMPTPTILLIYCCQDAEMCPGLGEWWLHKGVLNLRNLPLITMLNCV